MKQLLRLVVILVCHMFSQALCGAEFESFRDTEDSNETVQTQLASYAQRIHDLESRLASLQPMDGCSVSPDCEIPCGCECNTCCATWFATADYLNWQIERNDLAFAIRDPAGLGVPAGGEPIRSLDLGSNSGFRTSVGYRTSDDWELAVRYTSMRADDNRIFAPGAGQVLAVQSSPATGLTNANSANAFSNFRYDVFDVQAGHWFDANEMLSINVLSGIRFASIDHHLRVLYDGGAFINGSVDVPTDVDAFGIRIGSELHSNLSAGFTMFGRAAISANVAEITANRLETNAGAVVINASQTTHPIVPALELALGLRVYSGNWSIAAGYEFENWFNLVSPLEFADNFNGGTLGRSQQDLGLHGVFVNAAYAF